jgi:hypothetical protein
MADNVADQHVCDARMEYGHLLTAYLSLANMFWVGYGAFFAINTLLATGLGLSYSDAAKPVNPTFLTLTRFLIPLTGIIISVIAIYTAKLIRDMQRLACERGTELEKLLFARMFSRLKPYSESFPSGTTIGSLLFMAIWIGALYAAFQPLIAK